MKFLALTIFLLASSSVFAQVQLVSGDIAIIRAHNKSVGTEGSFALIQLKGVSDVLDCTKADLGKGVLAHFVIDNEEKNIYSMLLAAYMSGKNVEINVDSSPSNKINGLCVVRYASIL
ncbi:MAG: hypothetical protein ACRBCI_05095 [Cellvibrionaceae bacterium]